jgi:hypothetical protein
MFIIKLSTYLGVERRNSFYSKDKSKNLHLKYSRLGKLNLVYRDQNLKFYNKMNRYSTYSNSYTSNTDNLNFSNDDKDNKCKDENLRELKTSINSLNWKSLCVKLYENAKTERQNILNENKAKSGIYL